jgi:hypothetical protein
MAPLYKPPTRVVSTQIPYLSLVTQADPEFERDKHRERQMSDWYSIAGGRRRYVDPYNAGVYTRKTSVYPVGQPYGGLDPLIEAALEPTVGNPIPGLYSGSPDGKGWA